MAATGSIESLGGLRSTDATPAILAGAVGLALLVGAWGFQYLGGLVPCEMCIWQRWPHAAAIWLGLGGGSLVSMRVLPPSTAKAIAWAAILAIAISGAIGIFHAGVEWKFWNGPPACTGNGYIPGQSDDFKVIRCDEAQWRLFGISLAGYNAMISLAAAAFLARMAIRK
jgi:disulfide bond formation protein DsbB